MLIVCNNKDAVSVERPQRFIDADKERIDKLAHSGAYVDKGTGSVTTESKVARIDDVEKLEHA